MNKRLKNEDGQLIMWTMFIGALLGFAALITIPLVKKTVIISTDDRTKFEASVIARNILEIGKYLFLYEKIVYVNDPMKIAGTNQDRGHAVQATWKDPWSGGAGNSMSEACGHLDALTKFKGSLKVDNGEDVLCPMAFRDPSLVGDLMEVTLLEEYAKKGRLQRHQKCDATPLEPCGTYIAEFDMTDALNPNHQNDLFIPMYWGERLLDEAHSGAFANTIFKNIPGGMNLEAKLKVEIFTDSSSFVAAGSERFIKLTAEVAFIGRTKFRYTVEASETLMSLPAVPKDFALFVAYPTDATNHQTESYRDSFKKTLANDEIEVYGRTFFNGDIDVVNLDHLPTFHEAVLISGTVTESGVHVGPDNLEKLREKFKKGIVTNYPAGRFLYDGTCAGIQNATGETITISNKSDMPCAGAEFDIMDYVNRLNGACRSSTVYYGCGRMRAVPDRLFGGTYSGGQGCLGDFNYCEAETLPDCMNLMTQSTGREPAFLDGGWRKIVVEGAPTALCSPIMAPAVEYEIADDANVYGTLFGGFFKFMGSAKFFSKSLLDPAHIPDIDSIHTIFGLDSEEAMVSEFNSSAMATREGVAVSLHGIPTVLAVGGENK